MEHSLKENWPEACAFCSILRAAFLSQTAFSQAIKLGPWGELALDSKCQVHPPLLKHLFGSPERLASVEDLYLVRNSADPYVYLQEGIERSTSSDESPTPTPLLLAPTSLSTGAPGTGTLLDSEWISIDTLGSWISSCTSRHGEACNTVPPSLQTTRSIRPMFLIDTWDMCLVPAGTSKEYVALSYSMGRNPFFKTLDEDVPRLLKRGSLVSAPEGSWPIPNTVANAIALVRQIGGRYLWNGTLCVIQDIPAKKAAEIAKIAAIYVNASWTIVASDGGDAYFGLRGLPCISQPRTHHQSTHNFGPNFRIICCKTDSTAHLETSPWKRRAWTFQEHLFSRRLLIFGNDTVYWRCENSCWEESVSPSSDVKDSYGGPFLEARMLASSMVPNMHFLRSLITCFNDKDLSHPGDIMNAFVGTASLLSLAFPGGFLFGLPTALFDIALLWQPLGRSERRIPHEDFPGSDMPSWSWAGWAGRIQEYSMCSGYDGIKRYPKPQQVVNFDCLIPTAQWCSHSSKKMASATPIPASWYQNREKYLSKDEDPLPDGWSRHGYTDPMTDACDTLPLHQREKEFRPDYFYTSNRYPDTQFWYPLSSSGSLHTPISSERYISCHTLRTWLCLAECFIGQSGIECRTIRDCNGTWAGAIRIHSDSGNVNFGMDENASAGASTEIRGHDIQVADNVGRAPRATTFPMPEAFSNANLIELVSISRGFCRETSSPHMRDCFHELQHPEGPNGVDIYEYHNVLYVEWEDGVAYRRGLGRVEKRMWELQKLEEVDLVLG